MKGELGGKILAEFGAMPLLARRKLETSKIDCGDKNWKKPCLFTFSSEK